MKKNLFLFVVSCCFLLSPGLLSAGELTGKINFTGAAPSQKAIDMSMDPACKDREGAQEANREVRTGEDGSLANVFVYVKDGLGDQAFVAPSEPVKLNQKDCAYEPRVFGVQAGQPIQISNSDPTLHNVHAMPENQKKFNLGMPMQGMKFMKKFDKPEVMVKIKCDVHPWMRAYAGVVTHPYFAVTGADGAYEIKDVAPGTYTLEAWHEKLGTQTQQVTVAEDGKAEINFTFQQK